MTNLLQWTLLSVQQYSFCPYTLNYNKEKLHANVSIMSQSLQFFKNLEADSFLRYFVMPVKNSQVSVFSLSVIIPSV